MQLKKARFEQLLGQLAQERGMVGKVRVFVAAWPLLQQLSPAERDQVALTLGGSWARKHFDRFVSSKDLSPLELKLQELLSRVEHSDPEELRSMARKLRRGEVANIGGRIAEGLVETLENEADTTEQKILQKASSAQIPDLPTVPPAPLELPAVAPTLEEVLPETDHTERPFEFAELVDSQISTDKRTVTDDSEARRRDTNRPNLYALDPETVAVTLDDPGLLTAAPQNATTTPREFLSIPTQPNRKSLEELSGSALESQGRPQLSPLGGTPRPTSTTAIQSLRLLRSLRPDSDTKPNTPQDRADLVNKLGGGWAARRGVTAMIRSGAFENLGEALQLIAGLDGPTAKMWCLADLLETRDLSPDEADRLLAACPSPVGRRRLDRRIRRRALKA